MTKSNTDFFIKSTRVIDHISCISLLDLDKIIEVLFKAWQEKRMIFLIGNGGSASTATHFASDLVKTVIDSPDKRGLRAISLADNIPLASATVNDWGKENLFIAPLRTFFNPGDIVVAFSVHGGAGKDKDGAWSQNLLQAIQYAKDNGGKTIGFAGFDGGAMKNLCDICLVVPAESTPLVESIHVLLIHHITFRLKEMINEK